jgi:hypothetical protein
MCQNLWLGRRHVPKEAAVPQVFKILGETAFDDLRANEKVIVTFFRCLGDCTGLLGATVEGITDGE